MGGGKLPPLGTTPCGGGAESRAKGSTARCSWAEEGLPCSEELRLVVKGRSVRGLCEVVRLRYETG